MPNNTQHVITTCLQNELWKYDVEFIIKDFAHKFLKPWRLHVVVLLPGAYGEGTIYGNVLLYHNWQETKYGKFLLYHTRARNQIWWIPSLPQTDQEPNMVTYFFTTTGKEPYMVPYILVGLQSQQG